ncbi:MAG: hypothetical protein AVDCRST_MAG19-751, partial [uncultured Thermomicrobiales bacterium]
DDRGSGAGADGGVDRRGGNDRRREAGAGGHPPPQLVRPRPHPGALAPAPDQAGRRPVVAQLDDALGPGYPPRRRPRPDGPARLSRPRRLLPLLEPASPQRPDPGERHRRRLPALDLADRRAGARPLPQGRLRLRHRRRRRSPRPRPPGIPPPAPAVGGPV